MVGKKKVKSKDIETSDIFPASVDSPKDDADYKYQLIQFCKSQKKGLDDLEILPASWLSWDESKQKCITRYPSPPYNAKIFAHLQRLVETEKPPSSTWPWWDVDIRGGAHTYEKALERINKLKTSAYAYTSDTDVDPSTKSEKAREKIIKKSTKELFDIAEVEELNDNLNSTYGDRDAPDNINDFDSSNNNSEPAASKYSKKKQVRRKVGAKKTIKARQLQDTSSSDEESLRREVNASTANDGNNNHERTTCEDTATKNLQSGAQLRDAYKPTNNFTPDTLFILGELKRLGVNLTAAIQANTAAIDALHDKLSTTGNLNYMEQSAKITVEQVDKANELDLPFESLVKFEAFDTKLKEDKDVNQILISSLKQLLDRNNNTTKSVTNILRRFFTQDLVLRFTAKKKIEGKVLLKSTNFGNCMIAALTNFHTQQDGTPINADAVLKAAGNAISNAKDWDGRKGRQSVRQTTA